MAQGPAEEGLQAQVIVTNTGAWEEGAWRAGGQVFAGAGVCRGRVQPVAGAVCFGARCCAHGAAGAIPGRCHGNQTSSRRDKQLDILARFPQD